jgi:methionyl-tRNA synthetase
LKGDDVLYVCGSDEYGVAVAMSAEMAGRTPKEHVDIFHQINKTFFETLMISFDHYSRTSWNGHTETTLAYFSELLANGYIEEKETEQLFSADDNKFLADRYVAGTCPRCGFESARGDECQRCGASYEATDLLKPRSKLTGAPLVPKKTTHWFLMLDKLQGQVEEWLDSKDWKPNVINFARSFLKELRPRAITRDSSWGIPVPLAAAKGKVLYVWFDAPIGYISASIEWAEQKGTPDRWKDYWCDPKTKLVQFVGKDNIPFHSVIFPAMTLGQNQPYKMVDDLPANEFYNLEGRQFSKSEGWYIDLDDFFKAYTAEQIRYTVAANAPETADSDFTWKDFQQRCNAELLGKYGNFVNRVLLFAKANCGGKIPPKTALEEVDSQFLSEIQRIAKEAADSYEQYRVRKASQLVMELAQLGNVYFDAKKPWQDVKQEQTRAKAETTIACCLECLKVLALISYPILPVSAQKIWTFLGFDKPLQTSLWSSVLSEPLLAGCQLPEPSILFQRIEDEQIEKEVAKLQALSKQVQQQKEPSYTPLKPEIDLELFAQVDLRVCQIITATPVPKSKKLLQLVVDLGFEKRTIVSGISQFYKPEELVGKKVVIVANLKPALLMGIESQGMVLAAKLDDALELPFIQGLKPGSSVS